MKTYPSYKPSLMPWLDKVPAHWGIMPAFSVLREKQHKNKGMIENTVLSLSYGNIVIKPPEKLHGLVPKSFETYQIVDPQDIIIRPTDLQNDWTSLRVGLSPHHGIITSAYICLRAFGEITPEYAYLLLHTYDLLKVFYGMGSGLRQNLGFDDLKRMPVLLPSLDEQQAIVSFLDSKLTDIDCYISEKERLIELLQEQKTAIINQAVTRGINPQIKMKDSNLGLVGYYPEHWSQLPLKRTVRTKITDGPHETPELVSEGFDFVSAEAMQNGKIVFEKRRGFISREAHERFCRKLRPQRDDVFFCKSGATTGKIAIVDTDKEFSVWSPLALIRVDKRKVLPEYMFLTLQAGYLQFQMKEIWSYGTQPNIAMSEIERLIVLLPPIEEQSSILEKLKNDLASLDLSVSQTEKQIEIMQEYRTSLIAEVVTGKIDVRN